MCYIHDLLLAPDLRRAAEPKQVTGIDDRYEPSLNPEVECRTDCQTPAQSPAKVIEALGQRGYID